MKKTSLVDGQYEHKNVCCLPWDRWNKMTTDTLMRRFSEKTNLEYWSRWKSKEKVQSRASTIVVPQRNETLELDPFLVDDRFVQSLEEVCRINRDVSFRKARRRRTFVSSRNSSKTNIQINGQSSQSTSLSFSVLSLICICLAFEARTSSTLTTRAFAKNQIGIDTIRYFSDPLKINQVRQEPSALPSNDHFSKDSSKWTRWCDQQDSSLELTQIY